MRVRHWICTGLVVAGPTLTAISQDAAPAQSTQKEQQPMVHVQTSLGDIVIELDAEKAPISAKNFLEYVDSGYYNGTIFHRVIDGFMIQGGGFDSDFKQKTPRAPIKNEGKNGLKNDRGTIAMARTSDPNSATAQFFINVADNGGLDHPRPDGHGYAVFGKVTKGMDVVDKIKGVATTSRAGHQNVPSKTVEILSIKRADD